MRELLKQQTAIKAMVLQDCNGLSLDFYEVENLREPMEGDKVRLQEDPKPSGEFVMPNGVTLILKDGEVESIIYETVKSSIMNRTQTIKGITKTRKLIK